MWKIHILQTIFFLLVSYAMAEEDLCLSHRDGDSLIVSNDS